MINPSRWSRRLNVESRRWLTIDGRHRLSNIWTNRVASRDSDGHALLQQAGLVAPSASGFFHLLPLGLRVQDRLVALIDKHMATVGAARLALSSVCDQALWQQSGRLKGDLSDGNHELMAVVDRKKSGFLLSPTHEETITALVRPSVQSYRDLPLRLYQITSKYRDELRPRHGLLRTKEFLMKDLYTFDATVESALQTYNNVRAAYKNLFDEIGIPYLTAEADSGSIGGKLNHEFHYESPIGEDTVWTCGDCSYTANDEIVDSEQCPKCAGSLSSSRTIEVGHTFHLGTRYSQPLGLCFTTAQSDVVEHAQMGCHGIGVSRLLGTIASVLAAPTGKSWPPHGLRWPRGLAPFDVLLITEPDHTDWALYDSLEAVGIDDRPQGIVWKLQRADLTGYPVVAVYGKEYRSRGRIELHHRATGSITHVDATDAAEAIQQMLAP